MGTKIRRVPAGWIPPVKEIKEEPKPEEPLKAKKTRSKKGAKKNESDS